MSFTVGSLFDGSGGFPLAAFMCGGVPVWASEIEPYPIAVTKSRFPYVKHLGSVTDIKGNEVEPVDVITFGAPCQDLSVAGLRKGIKHVDNGDEETTRSGLFMDAVRIIKEMREATNGKYPRFAIYENVPGAFSSSKGEDWRTVLEELIKIVEPTAVVPSVPKNGWPYADNYCGDGWSIAYRVFDAQHWGVPQRRRRIYLVLDLGGQCAGKVLSERQGLRGYFETGRTPWQTTPGDVADCAGAADCEGDGVIAVDQGGGKSGANFHHNLSPTLTCTHGGEPVAVYAADAVAYSVQDRAGCPGGGKGMLVQENRATSLRTANYQYIFQPVVDSHILDDQGGQQISVREDGKSPTLRAEMHGNIPCVLAYDARGNGDGAIAPTITGDHNNRITDYTCVCCEPIPIHDQATRFSGKRGDNYDGKGNGLGVGNPGDPMNTITSGDRHAVAYGIGNGQANQPVMEEMVGALNCMHDQQAVCYSMKSIARNGVPLVEQANPICASDYKDPDIVAYPAAVYGVDSRNATEYPEMTGALQADAAHNLNSNNVVRVQYIVRRLTPTECARLQGFPDDWAHPDQKSEFTDEEYEFWLNVRNTHAEINGKAVKDYTKDQMLTWYNKLHTDSAEYKLWGNGIALPNALYVMQGIADVFN